MIQRSKKEVSTLLAKIPFVSAPMLSGAHQQTLYQPLTRRLAPLSLENISIPTPDGDQVDLFVHAHEDRRATQPLVLIVHGLEGNHFSPYVRGLQVFLRNKGWGSACMVFRSCNGAINPMQQTYHSGETSDLSTVLDWICQRYPARPLFLVGYSLGGNQVAKLLGTCEESLPLHLVAAGVVSPPFDLLATSTQIDKSFAGIYRRHFLKTLLPKARAKAEQFPNIIDSRQLKSIRTLRQFDNAVTSQLHGFVDAEDYYRQVAWPQFAPAIKRPLLVISSLDDPFSPESTIPEDLGNDHPWLHPLLTKRGGHLGFVGGTLLRPTYWTEPQLLRFFQYYLNK